MIELIKQLRDETGVSISKCQEALTSANGDMARAREILRELSVAAAAKKSDRELGAGTISTYLHTNKQNASMIELLCETDFVGRNDDFIQLAQQLAMHIAAMGSNAETLREEPFLMDPEKTVQQVIEGAVQKLGERIEIGRVVYVKIGE